MKPTNWEEERPYKKARTARVVNVTGKRDEEASVEEDSS